MSKRELRQSGLRIRRAITRRKLEALSESVAVNLFSLREFQDARTIASYVATDDEVQTERVIKEALHRNKRVIVPVTYAASGTLIFSELRDYDSELRPGYRGILEPRKDSIRPVQLDHADVILVPLVAWDARGHRIGYGEGYFDKALAEVGRATTTIGLALETQRLERVPGEPHDVPLRIVVTEERVLRFPEAS